MTNLTTEARRHGEESGDLLIARDRVIGKAACICHPERAGANATASRRTPAAPIPEHAASGSSHEAANLTAETLRSEENHRDVVLSDHRITRSRAITRSPSAPALLKGVVLIIRATLREIFDESAYDRFLLRTHASRSIASYREFTRERDAAMLKKPRCC